MIRLVWMLVAANLAGWGTWLAGWWSLPVVAFGCALAAPKKAAPLVTVPAGCVMGWGLLLLRDSRAPNFQVLLDLVARLFPVPGAWLALLTVVWGAVLALGAALLGSALRGPGSRT